MRYAARVEYDGTGFAGFQVQPGGRTVQGELEAALRSHTGKPKLVVFRMRHVPAIDASALHSLEVAVEKMQRDGVRILLTAVQPQPMKMLFESGLVDNLGLDNFCANIDEALERSKDMLAGIH